MTVKLTYGECNVAFRYDGVLRELVGPHKLGLSKQLASVGQSSHIAYHQPNKCGDVSLLDALLYRCDWRRIKRRKSTRSRHLNATSKADNNGAEHLAIGFG